MSRKRRREVRALEVKELEDFTMPEKRKVCANRAEHFTNLIIWGQCQRCDSVWGLSQSV